MNSKFRLLIGIAIAISALSTFIVVTYFWVSGTGKFQDLVEVIERKLLPSAGAGARFGNVHDLYQEHCSNCHGKTLQGGLGSPLVNVSLKYGHSNKELTRSIAKGIPDSGMPAWGGVLSSGQIQALIVYIQEQRNASGNSSSQLTQPIAETVFRSSLHDFKLRKLGEGDGRLWALDFTPSGSILSTQRNGKLWEFVDGKRIGPIEGIPPVWQHYEGGLMDICLHPDFEENGWIYLSLSESTGEREFTRKAGGVSIVRGKIAHGRWSDQETMFTTPAEHHTYAGRHFGSRIVFSDKYLFFSIGDRGRRNRAQDLSSPNGKVHRILDDGRIPEDNPFRHSDGTPNSIWSFGLRNTQGIDIDPTTSELVIVDHGPRGGDELNILKKGENYGWPLCTFGINYNGSPITPYTEYDGTISPALHWTPSIAPSGIKFHSGNRFPAWNKSFLVSCLASEELRRVSFGKGQIEQEVILKNIGRVRDVAISPDGYPYIIINSGNPMIGHIYKLEPIAGE